MKLAIITFFPYNFAMKIAKSSSLDYVPASHEDPKNPGVLKKVLFTNKDLIKGQIMMVNWAKLPKGKSFRNHYHEDMEEVFIILTNQVRMTVDNKQAILQSGDAVVVPIKSTHIMENISSGDVEYLVFGIALEQGGKTVNV